MEAVLVLEDGTVLKGYGFGAEKEVYGELVFTTVMTGYVEVLTDPSYKGQIVVMTYPLIGNYGVSERWFESDGIKVEGYVVREATSDSIKEFLKSYDIPGIEGIDTRFLTKKIRSGGVVKACLKTGEKIGKDEIEEIKEKVKDYKDISEIDLVPLVSTKKVIIHKPDKVKYRCVLIDCGVKKNIINNLLKRNCEVIQVPYNTSYDKILEYKPDFVLISNGPGDPKRLKEVIKTIKCLFGHLPLTGICLGNQLLALALGGDTYKMKFGHRGGNHPVKDLRDGKVYITSQNHGFAVKDVDADIIFKNLNDNTVEGIADKDILSVQFHPEARPGPRDTEFIFDQMVKLIRR
ncbi:carbamoyl phosphate synthase small subunit [Methanocaldococcus villosus KIN24-T80]|uniref:Carbamoyl phosphate synthase small chain n=1 Tax=Methanocaldococcus villosus KIN24-T80 TaxID=1069083 RepID=N6VZH5_9EURY|nr:glutamine-hydrolyzing carbamoyl-phosphate synthase small subunit [Methanocaldococcus villosus]ENN96512.1 carbamoyl phosphate synthase small subunit [Methanocaldococcus villosus KIN24-T80]